MNKTVFLVELIVAGVLFVSSLAWILFSQKKSSSSGSEKNTMSAGFWRFYHVSNVFLGLLFIILGLANLSIIKSSVAAVVFAVFCFLLSIFFRVKAEKENKK